MYEAYNNWGNALGGFAQTKMDIESDVLYHESFEKYHQALAINPDCHEAYNNWGNALGDLARTKTGVESEVLYREAIEKFQQAVTINPNYHKAYNNWGYAMLNLAQTKTGVESEWLYQEAFEKVQKAIELGEHSYSLACLYTIRSDKENALSYLERCLANKEKTVDYVKQDRFWNVYRTDEDFLALLRRFE
jgi:tetratricopeptide (TPR) repeat protein